MHKTHYASLELLQVLLVTTPAYKANPTAVATRAAQQGGSGKGSGNSANQGINQGQSNAQNALCLSGALLALLVTTPAVQGQSNSGSNAVIGTTRRKR